MKGEGGKEKEQGEGEGEGGEEGEATYHYLPTGFAFV